MSAPGAYPPPPSAASPGTFAAPPAGRGSMALRHLVSVVVALVLTPIGILVFDYGSGKYLQERARTFDSSGAGGELVLLALGALLLAVVAALGRLSGLGPVVAGLVWGALPFCWYLVDLRSFYDLSRDLPSTYFWFAAPSYLFPLVGALLVGAGVGGRWRGPLR